MRALRRIAQSSATAALVALVVGASGAGAVALAATPGHGTAASVDVTGTVVRLIEEPAQPGAHAHEGVDGAGEPERTTAVRTADGAFVPVEPDAVAGLEDGTKVTVTAQVPPVVAAAAETTQATTAPDGTRVRVNRADLAEGADGTPAASSSQLAKATAAAAAATGTALTTSSTTVAAAASTTYTPGVHELTIAVVAPQGVSGASATAAQLQAQVASASSYWSQVSGGGITLRIAKVTPRYLSAYRCGDDVFSMWSEAAKRSGFVEGPNRHLVISFPKEAARAGCPYGLASIGAGVNNGGVAIVSDTAWPVLAHEIGHNFGLGHAKALRCTKVDVDLASVPAGCQIVEYGYPWDVMAASSLDSAGTLSSVQATRIGLIGGSDVVDVSSGSRTITLNPMYTERGTRAVRVHDPKSNSVYFVEYRVRSGRDAILYQNVPNGVRVLQVDRTAWQERGSVTLDPTPTGSSADLSRQVAPGSTFRSYSGGVSVTVVSAGAKAVVTVSAGSTAAPAARPKTAKAVAAAKVAAATVRSTGPTGRATVSWSGGASSARYDVEYRQVVLTASGRRSLGPIRTWKSGTSATKALFAGRPGSNYQFRARVAGAPWSGWHSVALPARASR